MTGTRVPAAAAAAPAGAEGGAATAPAASGTEGYTATDSARRRTADRPGVRAGRLAPGPDLARELELLADLPAGHVVLGVDEVGRGALAGPVSVGVCAVGHRTGPVPAGLDDSKLLRAAVREGLVTPVREWALGVEVGHAGPEEIDAHGILAAQRLAASRALDRLRTRLTRAGLGIGVAILDGTHDWLTPADLFDAPAGDAPAWDVTVVCEARADLRCASVAGASVVAKVERDALMTAAAARPELAPFGLAGNKGYGSASHRAAIAQWGPTDFHRRSWRLPAREGGMMAP